MVLFQPAVGTMCELLSQWVAARAGAGRERAKKPPRRLDMCATSGLSIRKPAQPVSAERRRNSFIFEPRLASGRHLPSRLPENRRNPLNRFPPRGRLRNDLIETPAGACPAAMTQEIFPSGRASARRQGSLIAAADFHGPCA